MSSRAADFMHRWIDVNIVADTYVGQIGLVARALIDRCHDDLDNAGISSVEVAGDMEVSVESVIIEAMENRPAVDLAAQTAEHIPMSMQH